MKRILFLVNHDVVIYNFRLEIVERLINDGHEVHISSPYGERIDDLVKLGAFYHEIKMERHGMNLKDEFKLLSEYKKLMSEVKPDIVFSFTIKPNIYGSIAARRRHIPFVANITGLGMSIHNGGIKRLLCLFLYRIALKNAQKVFFQNQGDLQYMLEKRVVKNNYDVLPGSGVNLEHYRFAEYPNSNEQFVFSYFGRIMKDKGIDELINAASIVKNDGFPAEFRLFGFFDSNYEEIINKAVEKGLITYYGYKKDIQPWIVDSHAIVQPSHHEGMSNVLLEAAASGRPVIASNIHGCKEAFIDGVSGFGFEVRNENSLAEKIELFINLPWAKKAEMGKRGRALMEETFDRKIIVNKYLSEVNSISNEKNS